MIKLTKGNYIENYISGILHILDGVFLVITFGTVISSFSLYFSVWRLKKRLKEREKGRKRCAGKNL